MRLRLALLAISAVLAACGEESSPMGGAIPRLTAPREPAEATNPSIDEPFIQEINHRGVPGFDRPAVDVEMWRGELHSIEPRGVFTATEQIFAVREADPDLQRGYLEGTALVVSSSTVRYTIETNLNVRRDAEIYEVSAPGSNCLWRIWYGKAACTDSIGHLIFDSFPLPGRIGRAVAILKDVRIPRAFDVVVVGEDGLAGRESDALFLPNRIPYRDARSATVLADGGIAVATAHGVMRILDRGNGPEWRVYNGERWLPNQSANAVLQDSDDLYFATDGGIARVEAKTMTLEEKLAPFVERIELRHDRDGAVADSHLLVKGDLSTNIPWDSDNDGSWTSFWLRAECLRYKVTGDPKAKANFDRSLKAMLDLRTLTGTDHFLARALIRKEGCQLDDCDDPDDGQWFTSPDGAWWVKADTSNDEVIAHFGMMGHLYDHCADDTQKQQIREHIAGIVGGIVDHGYQLVDLDGLVTTYGQFDPKYVKESIPGIFGDGGLRAAEILAGLTLAHYLTGEERFHEAKRFLIDEYGYDEEAKMELERVARRAQMDNDDMAVWSFNVLLRYEPDPALYAKWVEGWQHEWDVKLQHQQAAWWDIMHVTNGANDFDARRIRDWLRSAPVDMIRWNMDNSERKDVGRPKPEDYFEQSGGMRSDGSIVPYDERPTNRWNTDSFRTEGGFDGYVEMDGADVLAPYWMARYYGFIRRAD